MKKLIIAAAALAMGFAANASYVDWSVKGTSATSGYTVLLFASAPESSYVSISDLKAASIGYAPISKAGRDFTTGKQSASGDAVKSTANFYFAIITSDTATSYNFVAATGMGSYVYDPPTSGDVFSSVTAADILGGSSGQIVPEPTPEPTSAMLLLLGVAGLALRRKQK